MSFVLADLKSDILKIPPNTRDVEIWQMRIVGNVRIVDQAEEDKKSRVWTNITRPKFQLYQTEIRDAQMLFDES